jgi:hypothetical protein
MAFVGAIEEFNRRRISGWARFEKDGVRTTPAFAVHFKGHPALPCTSTGDRTEGTGFVFDLPAEFGAMQWSDFIAAYDGVIASVEGPSGRVNWRPQMYKSVLINRDLEPRPPQGSVPSGAAWNPTTLAIRRLKQYSIPPVKGGRLAAFTIAFNEALVIPIWARYYAKIVGPENLFILDHSSTVDYTTMVPEGVTVIRLPRDAFDNYLIARTVAMYQRFLLESYDSVLYTDSDEFVCADPELSADRPLKDVLLELDEPIGITTGFNLWHDLDREKGYDPALPVLDQRRMLVREKSMDKPLISRVPLSWVPGFHSATEGGSHVRGLYMIHLRMFDLDHALIKGGHYRESKWNPFDVENRLAAYQRLGGDDIEKWFRDTNAMFRRANVGDEFDPNAQYTTVASWMKEAVWV